MGMKKLISLLVCSSIFLASCSISTTTSQTSAQDLGETLSSAGTEQSTNESLETENKTIQIEDYGYSYSDKETANTFLSVQDTDLLTYMEDVIYYDLLEELDSTDYCLEDVQTVYVSQEYIEELTYNSLENVYFGYRLSEIKEVFGDTPWFFTVDENGQTVVTEYQYVEFEYNFNKMIKDIAIGAGVILVCATVGLVTAPTMPAVSMIMMVSAKTATKFALSSGALGFVAGGLVTYIETGDVDQSLQAAMDSAGEGFKMGAIAGAVAGAGKEALFLNKASTNLSWNEVATIQKESKYPADVISQIHNMSEYEALANADLKPVLINNQTALVPSDVDFNLIDDNGLTNLQRMERGLAPLDVNGNSYELHHIGQEANATLAMLTKEQHDSIALHGFKDVSEIDRNAFAKQRKNFYKCLSALVEKGI